MSGMWELATTIAANPLLVRQLPRWVRDSGQRKDPLAYRQPWWNYNVRTFLDGRIKPGYRVFEYGGGASTLWLSDQKCIVHTVEHDADWWNTLTRVAPTTVTLDFRPQGESDFDDYIEAIATEADSSLDLVIVDGRERVRCGLNAITKIKPGGMLLLDDSDRPRYSALHAALVEWEGHHLRGLKPGDWASRQTSVWINPTR